MNNSQFSLAYILRSRSRPRPRRPFVKSLMTTTGNFINTYKVTAYFEDGLLIRRWQ